MFKPPPNLIANTVGALLPLHLFLAQTRRALNSGTPRGHSIGPRKADWYTQHRGIGTSKYSPKECRARGNK